MIDDILLQFASQGLAPAIVVGIYLIIVKIIDGKRESKQININKELGDSINNLCKFVNNVTQNIIDKDKDKCEIAIKSVMNNVSYNLTRFVVDTLINNHIQENKENILINIDNIVTTEYYNAFHILSLYIVNNVALSSYMKRDWIDSVKNDIISFIYNTKLSNEDKILSFNNKIDLKFQSYISYIVNNGIKK